MGPALGDELGDALEAAAAAPRRLEEVGPGLVAELRAIAEGAEAAPAPANAPAPALAEAALAEHVFRREGALWTLSFDGRSVHLPDLKGLHDLARLLAAPGEDVHCLELAGAADLPRQGDAGALLDERARADYGRRMGELREEAELAAAAGDDVRAEAARRELETLTEAIAAAFGLGGRPRRAGDLAERARSTVTARMRSAVTRIEESHPARGRHLRNSVRTGTFCSYQPERTVKWVT